MFPLALARLVEPPLTLARIESQERDAYAAQFFTDSGAETHARAALGGALRHAARDASDLPVVGDYVALELAAGASQSVVRAVLPRQNLFARRAAGAASQQQPIASNLDTLFVTVACNRDFNLRRIERYLAGAEHCDVPAAILLTKIDLTGDPESFANAAASVAAGRPVVALSARDRIGLEAFDAISRRGAARSASSGRAEPANRRCSTYCSARSGWPPARRA